MNQLTALYPLAVEHTKKKIYEDIDRYLEDKEELPSYEQFLMDRRHYIEQIWINVWLNKVTNDVSRSEKKASLSEMGYEVEGVNRKLINQLFRNEMRTYQPFDVMRWLDETFANDQKEWEKQYQKARTHFLEREKEKQLLEKRTNVKKKIVYAALNILKQDHAILYLYVRHYVACQLASDLKKNTRHQAIDPFRMEEKRVREDHFDSSNDRTVSTFFHERTRAIHKMSLEWELRHYEYETYYYEYERLITYYLCELIPKWLIERLSPAILNDFQEIYGQGLTESKLKDIIVEPIFELVNHYFLAIQEEYLSDLLKLANIPFDVNRHKAIYEKDIAERERRKAEELAEIERKKEEERQMLEDIFGREYIPSVERNIHYVLHIGETNTGKTHQSLKRMKEASSGLYLAPLRLLALEIYDKLNAEGVPCSLKTGEEEKTIKGANHISCTVEMFHEKDFYDVVVIDEAQMIADKDRGFSWYKAITKANAAEVHIIGSRNMKTMILQLLGNSNVDIREYNRDIPLKVESEVFNLTDTKKGDALVCFSRKRVLGVASSLQNNGHSVSMIYGSMPPETRKKQIQRFNEGETTVIVSTDAIGMGLNLPIRRIVFLENEKFDGTRRRRLTSQEVKQIAGRAGRKGIYNVGKVAFTKEINIMTRLLNQEDESISTFTIAPTNAVLERFQNYSRTLVTFFELWEKFESPKGTKKATLSAERELYHMIRDTEVEVRLSIMNLYGFLHLPFSTNEPRLMEQWRETMFSIVNKREFPEPQIKRESLEELELAYKAVGLHLLFLYRLDQRTEALYWERLREEISEEIHDTLKKGVKNLKKICGKCGKTLPRDFPFQICDDCHAARYPRRHRVYDYGD
ncbi:DEAD/DEAH box helicase [Ectobacillus panaciterrae]|uniref:DEAD/DEAH box helicase n=1 Tax=Ectobacillus panaciterrae TaxID=363872 RepID=UPI00041639D4|nr:DEAD/DEAH box helicase [Ectobacillus panaciterrae]